jgi:putative sigma-54 modulation protein
MDNNDLILSGKHIELTESLKTYVAEKTEKLFRHESRIVRLRVDLDCENPKHSDRLFIAHGIISLQGPDLVASHTSPDMHLSIDALTQKLDRMLRNRARHERDKRNHPHPIDLPADLPKV